VTLDPVTGTATLIGDTGHQIAGIAFDSAGTLYAVSGSRAPNAETLFTVNLSTAALTPVKVIGAGWDGEAIAYNSDDGQMYHAEGWDIVLVFEKMNLNTLVETNIPYSGSMFLPTEVIGFVYDSDQGLFLGTKWNATDVDYYTVTPAGFVTIIASNVIPKKGYAFSVPAPAPFAGIVGLGDLNSNGSMDVGIAMPGSTVVHIRDGSTDALISDINFGNDDAVDIVVLPDLNASGDPEIALLNEQDSGQVRVQIRDSVTGGLVNNLWYGMQYEAVKMTVVPDYSGNGDPEIAVLGSESGTDAVRVQLRDSSSNTFVDNVFLGTQSIARDVVSVTDTSGNGIPEMGILGVLKANNHVRMQMWDADTAAFQTNVWFGQVYQPQSTIVMPDINTNGSDEIVAVGVDPGTQNIRVQVRDSDTTATLFNIWLGNVNEAVDIALINDIDSDGIGDLAILLKTPAGVGRVRVQSGADGSFIRNLFFSVVENPVGLAVLADYSGNGFDELAALGESAGVRHVQILDTSTGTQVNRIDFP
jgi:hypothetical protein